MKKWIMLAVILGFAVIVGLAKRLRKLLVQEKQEGFTQWNMTSNENEKYYDIVFFINTNYALNNKNEWWNDENEFIFDALLKITEYTYIRVPFDDITKKLYKSNKIIGYFFNAIGYEPISMCFDIIKIENNINIIEIRDPLKVDKDSDFFKKFYKTIDDRCLFDDNDPDKLLRDCHRDDLVKFYSIINRTCEYTKKYRQNIGRIPKIISESYVPSMNFGFLRFDHMIGWVNYYNERLYKSHLSESNSKGVDKLEADEETSDSKCSTTISTSTVQTALERPNDFLEQFYGFINDDLDSYGKFHDLLFGDKSKSSDKGILKKKHYNIIRELQFDNMGFVNEVFKKIEIQKKLDGSVVISKGKFKPILNILENLIFEEYNILVKVIQSNTLKSLYVNNKDRTVIYFLLVIGYLNIYPLIQHNLNNLDPTKTDTIIKNTEKIKDYYKRKHLVYKDTGKKLLTLSDDNPSASSAPSAPSPIDAKIENLESKLSDPNSKNKPIVEFFKDLDKTNPILNEKELKRLKDKVGDKPIRVINVVLESDAVQKRRSLSVIVKKVLEENIYKPLFENTDINTMRAFFNNMVKVLGEEDSVKNLDVNDLSSSECDKCLNDFLIELLKPVEQKGGDTSKSATEEVASATDADKIILTTTQTQANIENKVRDYQIKIVVSILEVGFKFFLLELAHHIANSQDTNPVGDVESKSRTARSSYELRDSLDLGHFYY